MAKTNIGFIGTGIMGKPMARNLLKAGYPLTRIVHSYSRKKLLALVYPKFSQNRSPFQRRQYHIRCRGSPSSRPSHEKTAQNQNLYYKPLNSCFLCTFF
jgi:hypothetical protein